MLLVLCPYCESHLLPTESRRKPMTPGGLETGLGEGITAGHET